MVRKTLVIAAMLVAGWSAMAGEANRPPLPEGVRVLRDVEYARVGERAMLLDLYLPESDKPVPLVIWVHGGAWLAGSKDNTPARVLLNDGFAVASISYRFSQVAVFPAQIEDCKAAVRFLRANAGKYRLDPDRFGAWGSSAGGHLVALMGTAGDVKEWDKGEHLEVSSRVQAVCDWFGPTDFTRMGKGQMDHDAADAPEAKLIGGPVQENKEKAAKANPITYVSKEDPPFLIMHGDADRLVPINQSELLHAALQKAGVESTFKVVEGQGHGFRGREPVEMAREFFIRALKR